MKRVILLRVIAIVLLSLQGLSYLSDLVNPESMVITDPSEKVGYYFGYNLFLLMGLTILYLAHRRKKRYKKKQVDELIDSIGKDEQPN